MSRYNKIVILDSNIVWNEEGCLVLRWSSRGQNPDEISIPDLLETNAVDIRSEYLRRMDLLKNHYRDFTKFYGELSYWWLTLLSESSTWKSSAVYNTFKAIMLEKELSKYNLPIVANINCKDLKEFLCKLTKNSNQKLEIVCEKLIDNNHWYVLEACAYYFREIIKTRYVLFKKFKFKFKFNKIVVSYSDGVSYIDHNVRSNYFQSLEKIIKSPILWLMLFIPTNKVPTLKQAIAQREQNVKCGSVLFFEELITLVTWIKVLFKYMKIFLQNYNLKLPQSSPFEFLSFWETDWNHSIKGKTLMSNCIKGEIISSALEKIQYHYHYKYNYECLFVYENQSWEKILIYNWKKIFKTRVIGFQHVPNKFFDIRPYISMKEPLITPDIIAVGGVHDKQELEVFSQHSKIERVEALRFQYLLEENIESSQRFQQGSNLLIITDYEYDDTFNQLSVLAPILDSLKMFESVIVKPHPNCPVEDILRKLKIFDKVKISTETLSQLWSDTQITFTSNKTAASIESCYLNIPTIIYKHENDFNMSPVRPIHGVLFVSSACELKKALQKVGTVEFPIDFLYLNKDFKLWKKLLED